MIIYPDGVQGVASSNPAAPTIENQRVGLFDGQPVFAWMLGHRSAVAVGSPSIARRQFARWGDLTADCHGAAARPCICRWRATRVCDASVAATHRHPDDGACLWLAAAL